MLLLACLALLARTVPVALAMVLDVENSVAYGLHAKRQQVDGLWWTRFSKTKSTTWTSTMLTAPSSGLPAPLPLSPPASDQTRVSPVPEPVYPTSATSTPTGFWTIVPAPSNGPSSTASSPTPSGTGAMPTDTTSGTAFPTTPRSSDEPNSSSNNDSSGIGSNRTLVITLSTVLSAVGVLLIVGAILICWRYRRHRKPLFARGISPIDDDEIATWKVPRNEKAAMLAAETDAEAEAGTAGATTAAAAAAAATAASGGSARDGRGPSHAKNTSTSSVKKPPSVIVYSNAHGQGGYRKSEEDGSPRSFAHSLGSPYYGKTSLDKALPQTPIQARAPNARAGLTDESIPGDDPFLPSPKRQPSRLSKMPPNHSSQRGRMGSTTTHTRARSSRSSTHSFGGYGHVGSDVGLSMRHSHENYTTTTRTHRNNNNNNNNNHHSRVYSSSSIPPRLSFGDEGLIGGLSPRPFFRDDDIGRAIG